jgi:hypothetical protein
MARTISYVDIFQTHDRYVALACGNAVVVKPSEITPPTATLRRLQSPTPVNQVRWP